MNKLRFTRSVEGMAYRVVISAGKLKSAYIQ